MKLLHWLRIFSTLHALSFVTVSYAAPTGTGKEPSLRASGNAHIVNAQHAPLNIVQVTPNTWTTVPTNGAVQPVLPGQHADHKLEVQTVKKALKKEGIDLAKLEPHHRSEISRILNDHWNMQLVNGGVNIGKGSVTRYGLQGNVIRPKDERDGYTRETVSHGVQTAERLDRYIKTIVKDKKPDGNHVYYQGKVRETHVEAMRGSGMIRPGEATPVLPPHLQRPSSVARPGATTPGGTPAHPHQHPPLSPVPGSPHSISFSPTGSPHSTPEFKLKPLPPHFASSSKPHPETPSRKYLVDSMSRLQIHGGASTSGHSHASPTESTSSDHSHSPSHEHPHSPGQSDHGHHDGHHHDGGSPSTPHHSFQLPPPRRLTRAHARTPERQTGANHPNWQAHNHNLAHAPPRPQPKRSDSI